MVAENAENMMSHIMPLQEYLNTGGCDEKECVNLCRVFTNRWAFTSMAVLTIMHSHCHLVLMYTVPRDLELKIISFKVSFSLFSDKNKFLRWALSLFLSCVWMSLYIQTYYFKAPFIILHVCTVYACTAGRIPASGIYTGGFLWWRLCLFHVA